MGKGIGKKLESKGRHGDTILAHINPREAMMLKRMGGSGSINPRTGLREYWDSDTDSGSPGDSAGNDMGNDVSDSASASQGSNADDFGESTVDPSMPGGITGAINAANSVSEEDSPGAFQGIMEDVPGISAVQRGLNSLRDTYPNAYSFATGALKAGAMTAFNPLSMGIGGVMGLGAKGVSDRSTMSPEARAAQDKSISEVTASKDLSTSPGSDIGESIGSDLTGSEYLDVPASLSAGRIILRGKFDKNLGISQANRVKVYR